MKKKSKFVCGNCTYVTPKWMGKCPECEEWNSFEEEVEIKAVNTRATSKEHGSIAKKINEINQTKEFRNNTGIFEFDRVVGGGLVEGSLLLIGGEPGIGKSTLLMEVCGKLSQNEKVLYVSGEESESQVASRSSRLNIETDNFYIQNEVCWEEVLGQIKKLKPKFLVIDSIQTTISREIQSAPGTVSQIREVTYEIMNYCKANKITTFIVGHITKEGSIAGPKILEHMVDTVVYFEGDQTGAYRILRVMKNRFGNTNEVGIFEMKENGLTEVSNPSEYFLENPLEGSYGRSLTCIIEGSRPMLVEMQALVVENKFGNGRRTTQGIDSNRLAMMVAIIEKYMDIPISYNDIYVNVVSGLKLTSRDSDLSIIASLLSSYYGKSVDSDIVFLGEVGLTGEVRRVSQIEMRLKELAQLNYRKVVTTKKIEKEFSHKFDIEILGVDKVSDLTQLFH